MPGGDFRDALRSRGGWSPERGPVLDADGERAWGSTAARRATPSASARASASRSASRATSRASTRPRTRSPSAGARTSRRARSRSRTALHRRRSAGRPRRAVRGARSGPRSGSAIAGSRRRDRAAGVSGEPARGGRWTIETDRPVWAIAPGQAASSTTATRCLGGGRIARPGPAADGRRDAGPSSRPGRRVDRVTIGPALPLALLVGLVHTVALRAHPRRRRRPAARDSSPPRLGAWAGDALGGRIGLDSSRSATST